MEVTETYWICEICLKRVPRHLADGWQLVKKLMVNKHYCPEHKMTEQPTATEQAMIDEQERRQAKLARDEAGRQLAQSGMQMPMDAQKRQFAKENDLAGTDKAVVVRIQTGRGEVTRRRPLDMQVCVPKEWTDEQVEEFANQANLAGTETGWHITREGDVHLAGDKERAACVANSDKVHIMLHV